MLEAKKKLRNEIKKIKLTFNDEERLAQSELIFSYLKEKDYFKKANTILLYWSMADEVYTHSFIEECYEQKTILLPSVNGSNLDIKTYRGKQSMKKGDHFGILEPTGDNFVQIDLIDLIIVPGVAFDKENKRMGRGRGYYDKLLNTANALKVGVCFDFQFFDNIPVEDHDIPMDFIIHG